MGFRNPFRIQVDENDVAYVTDYSPDSQTPAAVPRAGRHGPRRDRPRKPANYGWPLLLSSRTCRTTAGTSTRPTPLDADAAAVRRAATRRAGPHERLALEPQRRPGVEPGLRDVPPLTQPDIWYSYRDNNATTPLGTPCFGVLRTDALTPPPGSTTPCPRLFPELYTGGVGPHGAAKYHYDPANPNPTKFPPYYDDSVILGEFTQDTLREVKLDSQNQVFKINQFLNCGAAHVATSPFPFECDNPMDMQFGRRRRLLPADLRRRLLQHQPGRRHVQVGVRQGPAGAEGGAERRPDRRRRAADGQLLQRGLAATPTRATRSRFEWDFGDGTATRPTRTRRTPTRRTASTPPS